MKASKNKYLLTTVLFSFLFTWSLIPKGASASSSVLNTLFILVDLKNSREIWRGEGSSSGDEISSLNLILSAGEAAIDDLSAKSIIPKAK